MGDEQAAGQPTCILLVEDDDRTLSAMGRLLRLNGYQIYTAQTAVEAMALADEHRCDVVVCDIGLPDRTGTDLMRDLKVLYDPKGIAVTGFDDPQTARLTERAGFDRHLVKPVLFTALLDAIRDLLPPEPHPQA